MNKKHALDLTELADERFVERFWSKVNQTEDCWPWTARINLRGYGQFTVQKGWFQLAHRVAFALTNGPIEAGMSVCHSCDNPSCVRPSHLFLGTQRDNALDMFRKGRQGPRHPGSARCNAKLNDDAVRAIRALPMRHGLLKELSAEYGVSRRVLWAVRSRKDWGHVR